MKLLLLPLLAFAALGVHAAELNCLTNGNAQVVTVSATIGEPAVLDNVSAKLDDKSLPILSPKIFGTFKISSPEIYFDLGQSTEVDGLVLTVPERLDQAPNTFNAIVTLSNLGLLDELRCPRQHIVQRCGRKVNLLGGHRRPKVLMRM